MNSWLSSQNELLPVVRLLYSGTINRSGDGFLTMWHNFFTKPVMSKIFFALLCLDGQPYTIELLFSFLASTPTPQNGWISTACCLVTHWPSWDYMVTSKSAYNVTRHCPQWQKPNCRYIQHVIINVCKYPTNNKSPLVQVMALQFY